MKERTVMLHLKAKSSLPIRILRRAKNYQLMVKSDQDCLDEIKVIQAQANVIKRKAK